jgi:hypothetical protein
MDYKNGKIYSLRTHKSDECYIGSTTQPLSKRFYHHKKNNNTSSKSLFEKYDDVYIELIELFPCETKSQLHKREGELQREHKERMVNKNIAGRTDQEYHLDNLDKHKTYKEQYRAENKELIAKGKKKHYEENKAKVLQKCKDYREANKEKIAEYKERKNELRRIRRAKAKNNLTPV